MLCFLFLPLFYSATYNFLLVAVENKPTVFDTSFLRSFKSLNEEIGELPHVTQVQSLTSFGYPVKTPFGIVPVPAINFDKPELLEQDKSRILQDERFVYNLINEDGTALVSFMKTTDQLSIEHSYELMDSLKVLLTKYEFEDAHILGRAFFQAANDEAIKITIKEIGMATLLTSMTTAVGFLSLLTSRLKPIQDFGVNSAMGVVLAFVCVILFTCAVLSLIPKEKLLHDKGKNDWWTEKMLNICQLTFDKRKLITISTFIFLILAAIGISKVSTNYTDEQWEQTGTI